MSDQQETLFPALADFEQAMDTFERKVKARARNTDRLTSHEAAASVTPHLTEYQKMVLRVAQHFYDGETFTDKDLVASYKTAWEVRMGLELRLQSDSGIRTRRNELVEMGHIKEAGKVKIGTRNHTTWRVV